jgi:hypothetical protein
MHTASQPPPTRLYILRRNTEPVLAAVASREGEATASGASLRDDTVVVIECLFNSYEDARVGFSDVVLRAVVPYFGVVVA